MPPEPLPWDRFKDRRYDRPPPDSVGPGSRWREPPPHSGFRGRLPGNGRPVPWRYHSAESGRGFSPSRVNDKFIGDEGFRPSGYRMDGRYNRFNRENNGPFVHRDMRGHTWENGMSPNSLSRPHFSSDRRSIDDRGSFGPKDIKGHFWENGRMQNGNDQRSLDEKGSFGRRDLRGKSWENGSFPDSSGRSHNRNDPCSVDDKEPFQKKDLKRRSPEGGFLHDSSVRSHISNDQRSLDEKGLSGQKDSRGKCCENGVLSNGSSRLHTGSDQSSMNVDVKSQSQENGVLPNRSLRLRSGSNQSPVDDMLAFTSPTHSDLAITQDELSKDRCDKLSGANDVVSSRKFEKENSLGSIDWKPLKWTRSGSLSSRGSGLSHSSCGKSADSSEPKNEVPPGNDTPLRSPAGDSVPCATLSAVSSEEAGSRKKPRLGWGEGLAKFEKKKIEGPDDDSATKPGLVICVSGEPSHVSNLASASPRVAGFLERASPATPSSVACSSSPGVEDKACTRSANLDYDSSYSSGSPNLVLQKPTEGNQERVFCLENVELTSVANLSSSLTELSQLEYPVVVESHCVRSTAMNKLLVWKGETLKALEITESVIDSLENDLKKLDSESESNCPHPVTSISLLGDCQAKLCENAAPSSVSQIVPQLVISSADVEKNDGEWVKEYKQVRDEDLDTPTSKFVEPLTKVQGAASSDSVKNAKSCENTDVVIIENLEKCPIHVSNGDGHSITDLSSNTGEALCNQILALNKDTAVRAFEVFKKLLPSNHCSDHALRTSSVSSWKDDPQIMEKFAFKKRCRRFDVRINTLKYRALQHIWKEDLQLTSCKNNRPKSHKRLETSSRGLHGSNQKHRTVRSRFSAAGNSSLAPTAEGINFTRKLLSDSQEKPLRNSLKMPALIVEMKERIASRFISNNGLVEDPRAMEKERAMINPWTREEKEIFMDKLAAFGKDFNKISSFLDHKTTADCVEFYYKNHKSDGFVKLKKKPDFARQGKFYSFNNYLVSSGKRWNREINAASLDVLGEVSAIAANADHARKTRQEASGTKAPHIDGLVERPHDLDVSVNERETEAANVLAGICGAISSEPMGSCITSSFDRGESYKELTNHRVGSDYDSCSDDSRGDVEPTDWTDEEKSILIQAIKSYGKDFGMISRHVGTKSRDQCKVFFSKVRKCLGLDTVQPRSCGEGNDDNNGGGSDNEGGCVMEADTVVYSEKLSPKGDRDVLLSDVHVNDLEKNGCEDPDESEKMSVDDLRGEIRPEVGLEGDAEMENGVDNEHAMLSDPTSTTLHPDIEGDRGDREALSSVGSSSADAANDHGFSGSCAEVGTVDPEEPQAEEQERVAENSSDSRKDDCSNDKQEASRNGLRDLNCVDQDLCASVNVSNVAPVSSDAPLDSGVNIKQAQKIALDLNPPLEESVGISLGGDSCSEHVTSVSEGIQSSTQEDFERIAQKLYKKSTSVGTWTQHQSSSSSVLVGYPVQVSVKKEMNGVYPSDMYLSQEGFLRRCSGSDAPISAVESPFHSNELKKSHLRHHSWSSSDTEKPRRNGDVKLFGQILKSQPKGSVDCTHENTNQELTGANNVDTNSVVGKFDRNNYLGLENVHSRSFGFWNGNKAPTGFPSMPDSAILLAKYPAAFSNFSSTSNIEQQQVLQSAVVKSNNNDHNLNGVSVFPSREMTTGNGVDYQLYRNQQDFISEMQRRNSIGPFSSLRNTMGVVGTNVGISDPVAAIKMHYAKVEQYGGGPTANNIVIEEEPWRGKADVGR